MHSSRTMSVTVYSLTHVIQRFFLFRSAQRVHKLGYTQYTHRTQPKMNGGMKREIFFLSRYICFADGLSSAA